jgi:hypothetical protein
VPSGIICQQNKLSRRWHRGFLTLYPLTCLSVAELANLIPVYKVAVQGIVNLNSTFAPLRMAAHRTQRTDE